MPTILELFDSTKKELYNRELIRIDSRGLINPPRVAALAASSPNTLADLVGGQLAGAIGGTANRPSDTIFKGNTPLSKPITITAATTALLRDVVESGTDYTVKQNPSPDSVLNNLAQGGSSPSGVATNLAIQGLNKFGSKSGLKKLGDSLKNKSNENGYTNKKPFSTHLKGTERTAVEKKTWSMSNEDLNDIQYFENDKALEDWIKENRFANQVPITFKKYGKNTIVPFVGAISGISEDVQPEWTNFKYVGSPFKTYRYQGVERSVKFNLKLYYMDISSKQSMIKKIEYLKSLAFPDEKVAEITYGSSQTSQYAFSPNLIIFSIGDLYKNMFGYIESLSFSIDDNTVWSNFNPKNESDGDNTLYPSVMDVSIGIKIIENHGIEDKEFKYNFNGTRVFNKKSISVPDTSTPEELQALSDSGEIAYKQMKIDSEKIPEEPMPLNEQQQVLENYRNMKT
jgi:hypothetical protein